MNDDRSSDGGPRPPLPRGAHPLVLAGAGALHVGFAAPDPATPLANEAVAAACNLGGTPPPGAPLHALLAHAFAWVPVGSIPLRVALLSALGGVAVTWAAGALVALGIAGTHGANHRIARFAPSAAALATALAPPLLLGDATLAAPGAWGLVFALLALHGAFAWAAGIDGPLAFARAGFFTSLAVITDARVALALFGALLVALAFGSPRGRAPRARALRLAVPAALLGLAPLLALPTRAAAPGGWSEVEGFAGFLSFVTGALYRTEDGVALAAAPPDTVPAALLALALGAGVVPILGVAALVARGAARRSARAPLTWVLPLLPVVSFAAARFVPAWIPGGQVSSVLGLPVVVTIVAGAVGLAAPLTHAAARVAAGVATALLALHLPGLAAARELPHLDAPDVEVLVGALVDTPPPRSLVVVSTDFAASSWRLARATDGARPDVAVLEVPRATQPWHWRTLGAHPVFSGRPIRGVGDDARAAHVEGAMRHAGGHIPLLAEDAATTRGAGAVAGPYLLVSAHGVPTRELRWRDSTGDRLMRSSAWAWAAAPRGAGDRAGGVLREAFAHRAFRLLVRHDTDGAREAYAASLAWLPAAERAHLSALTAPATKRWPPIVRAPDAQHLAQEDVVRQAALALWSTGATAPADALLEAQRARGDARALLQRAWWRFADGDRREAEADLLAFGSLAPDLRGEGAALAELLEGSAAPSAPAVESPP